MPEQVFQPKVLLMVSGGSDSATLASFVRKESAPGTLADASAGKEMDDAVLQSSQADEPAVCFS